MISLNPYGAAAGAFFVLGAARMVFVWRRDRWVRRIARRMLDGRRALYTEIPRLRPLGDEELVEKRAALDRLAEALPGFRHLADYVDEYEPGSRFRRFAGHPYRVLVDADGRTTALVFRSERGAARIHLATELAGDRWVLTENNHGEVKAERAPSMSLRRLPRATSPAAMVSDHAKRVAKLAGDGGGPPPSPIRTFDDWVASHERRWDAIRAHRRSIGWVLPSEITFAPGTPQDLRERVYREIQRLAKPEAG